MKKIRKLSFAKRLKYTTSRYEPFSLKRLLCFPSALYSGFWLLNSGFSWNCHPHEIPKRHAVYIRKIPGRNRIINNEQNGFHF